MMRRIVAAQDADLIARVVSCRPLVYSDGADASLDRPAHVRAGSGMTFFGGRLAVIQDDANFVAFADPSCRMVESVALPIGHLGLRQFDDVRGNKQWKTDLEACTTIVESGRESLLAMGSGSSPAREQILMVHWPATNERDIERFDAQTFYAALRSEQDFAGSELNIEGAVMLGDDCLRLFQRGNGTACRGLTPLNATCDISWRMLRAHLGATASMAPPRPQNVVQYDLGQVGGVSLGFTDGAVRGADLFFSAAAEASPNAVDDGPVSGSVIGVIEENRTARWTVLLGPDGTAFRRKVEGLCLAADDGRGWVLIDRDDSRVPTELCEIELLGRWTAG